MKKNWLPLQGTYVTGLQEGPELGQRFCFVAKTLQEVRVFRGSPNASFLILVFYSFPFNMLLLRNLTKT